MSLPAQLPPCPPPLPPRATFLPTWGPRTYFHWPLCISE